MGMSERSSSDPWADIAPGGAQQTVSSRRVDVDHPLDFYWTRDYMARCGLMLRLRKPITEKLQKPSLGGVDIVVEAPPSGGGLLLLVLKDAAQHDLFRIICRDLLQATRTSSRENETAAVAIILNRLQRWQELLKVRSQGLLSRQAQIGLLGELLILDSIFLSHLGPREGVAAWRGPTGGEQDFGHGQWLLEVKTQLSTSDQALQITSLAQLDDRSGTIVVCHQTLGSCGPSDDGAVTLRGVASGLRQRLEREDLIARDLLDMVLLESGYVDREEYGELSYQQLRSRFFRIADGFPRLVPATVPVGIRNVQYQIEISTCSSFEIDGATLEREMFENHAQH